MFHDVEQNTDEWLDLRTAKLTGSGVPKIMANYGKAFGEPAKKLAVSIAREQITGRRSIADSYSNAHMERGHEQEPFARALYEEQNFVDVSNGGFFEDNNLGCSPDGLVYQDGLIEIKSVIDHVHYSNIKRGGIDPTYKWQIFFNLMVTKRDWIDFVSYCADFPEETQLYVHRVHMSDCMEEFGMMANRITEFFDLVEEIKLIIKGK
jgi:hypothetical protein